MALNGSLGRRSVRQVIRGVTLPSDQPSLVVLVREKRAAGIRPRPSLRDVTNVDLRDAKCPRQGLTRFSSDRSFTDSNYLRVRQLRVASVFAFSSLPEYRDAVADVLSTRHQLEVLQSVVVPDPVLVVDLEAGWNGSAERLPYQPMYLEESSLFVASGSAEPDVKVAVSVPTRLHLLTSTQVRVSPLDLDANISEVRHGVDAFVSRDRAPLLGVHSETVTVMSRCRPSPCL